MGISIFGDQMKVSLILLLIIYIVLCFGSIGTASAGQYDYVEPPEYLWTCFDHAMHFSQDNPEWGMVLLSSNPRFKLYANNHFVNYKILDTGELNLYDVESGVLSRHWGWQYDTFTFDFYHFYAFGEIPTRQHIYLLPNAEAVYNAI